MKFEFRHESLKNKFSPILFVYGLMNELSKENGENYQRKLKFNPKFKQ